MGLREQDRPWQHIQGVLRKDLQGIKRAGQMKTVLPMKTKKLIYKGAV